MNVFSATSFRFLCFVAILMASVFATGCASPGYGNMQGRIPVSVDGREGGITFNTGTSNIGQPRPAQQVVQGQGCSSGTHQVGHDRNGNPLCAQVVERSGNPCQRGWHIGWQGNRPVCDLGGTGNTGGWNNWNNGVTQVAPQSVANRDNVFISCPAGSYNYNGHCSTGGLYGGQIVTPPRVMPPAVQPGSGQQPQQCRQWAGTPGNLRCVN